MVVIHKSICKRMPEDLRQYLETYDGEPIDFASTARKPFDLQREIRWVGSFRLVAYFGPCNTETVVIVHYPGGIDKQGEDRDKSWCSNMANDTSSIFVCVDYPKLSECGFQRFSVELEAANEILRQLCDGIWKEQYDTSSERMVLSSSSFGAFPTLTQGVQAFRSKRQFYGYVSLVPLFDTDPDPAANPWGENVHTVGLEPDRLLEDLEKAFNGDGRDHWTRNSDKMPNEILKHVPRTVMVLAKLDILYPHSVTFRDRLKKQGVEVESLEVDSIHQVKELYNTEQGRKVWEFCTKKYRELIALAQSASTPRD